MSSILEYSMGGRVKNKKTVKMPKKNGNYQRIPAQTSGGRLTKVRRNQILVEIGKVIESGLIHGQTNTALASQFKISTDTFVKLRDEVYAGMNPETLEDIYKEFVLVFKRLFRETYKLLQEEKQSGKEKRENIKLLLELMRERTDLLERFFYKPRAPENFNVQSASFEKLEVEIIDGRDKIVTN